MKTSYLAYGVTSFLCVLGLGTQQTITAADCYPPPSGIAAWWQAEGNASDLISGVSGVMEPGASFTNGVVGQCFSFDGATGCVLNDNTPSLTSIQNSFTIEFWAYPQGDMTFYESSANSLNSGGGMQLAVFPEFGGSGGQAGVGIGVGTNGIAVIEHAFNYLPTLLNYTNYLNGWVHVALVYSDKQPILYVNGANVATGITSTRTYVYPSKDFGGSISSPWNTYGPYEGLLDEISIYNRALTATEIAGIYNAGTAGKCSASTAPQITSQPANSTNELGSTAIFAVTAAGTSPLSFQWSFSGTNIFGATNNSLTISNVQFSQAGDYSVTVSNAAGSTNSVDAALVVYALPPVITSEPVSQAAIVGASATFSVTATGTAPLAYLWSLNGTNIPGATNSTLALGDVQFDQAGNYTVQISNLEGTTNSSIATISVNAAPDCTPTPSGIVDWWQGQGNAYDVISGSTGTIEPGTTFTNGMVGQCFSFNGVNGCVLNNNTPSLTSIQNSFTIEFWAYPQGDMTFYAPSPNSLNSGGGMQFAVFPEFGGSDGQAGVGIGVGTNGIAVVEHAFNYLPTLLNYTNSLNGWVHVALVYSDKQPVLYVNGANVATGITSTRTFVYPSKDFGGSTSYPWSVYGPYKGLLDEVSIYNRALTAGEISSIYAVGSGGKCYLATPPQITSQPASSTNVLGSTATLVVTAAGTPPLSFQWSFDGTNITGATNSTLRLTNLQFSQAGDYSVIISDPAGSTNSIDAVLVVNPLPLLITTEPASQVVVVGSSASFTVTASGTAPLTYQWIFNGTNIAGATSSTLSLADVQFAQAGNYAVQVSDLFGITNSLAAVLTVDSVPPCDSAPSGMVGWWQGEGNALDAISGSNGVVEPGTTFTNGIVGESFCFDGNTGCVMNTNTPTLTSIQNNFTIEFWAYPAKSIDLLPQGGGWGISGEGYTVFPEYGASTGGAGAGVSVGTNGICVIEHASGYMPSLLTYAKVITGWTHIAVVYTNKQPTLYVNGVKVLTGQASGMNFVFPGKNLGGSYGSSDGASYITYGPYKGLLDEVSIYDRALGSNEIASIYSAASAGKCPAPPFISAQPASITNLAGTVASFAVTATGMGSSAYQWSFDGTNINNATNATLTLTNVQPNQAGVYAVLISNLAGATNSVDATLTVVTPPTITLQPLSQTALNYGTVSFAVAATGSGPLTYQWQKNGTNLVDNSNVSGSTTTNLTIEIVSLADAADYQVLVSDPYATTNSTVAVLTVPETVISLGSTNAMSGTTITVPVLVNALGVENTLIASVGYDTTKLALQDVQLSSALAGAYFQEVDTQTNNGYVGFAILLNTGATIPAGTQEVAYLVFQALPVTNTTSVTLTFGDTPNNREVVDNALDTLPAIYQSGTVQLTPAEYCADVYPRFNGDHMVNVQDWLEVGRMVAGLDIPTNSDELLRADCAPRNAPDGVLTVADWVQAGRYALGLDPLTLVNPAGPAVVLSKATPKDGQTPTRILQVATVSAKRGQTVTVPVSLLCTTNENAAGFTVSYNSSQLNFISFAAGSAISSGRWNVNSNQPGKVGFTLAVSPGNKLPAGTNQMGILTFAANANASGTAALTLDGSVVKLQTADLRANNLTTAYVNGAVVLPSQPTLGATFNAGQLQFNWSLSTGTYQVQTADQPSGPWTTVTLPLTVNGDNVSCSLVSTNQQKFFRLLGN